MRSSENSSPRKNSSSTIPSRASRSMPSEGSMIVGNPGEGPRRIPARMKIGIADRPSRAARTLATAHVTQTMARSLSSSRWAFGSGSTADRDAGDTDRRTLYRAVSPSLPTISDTWATPSRSIRATRPAAIERAVQGPP
jgi:hypothetical protein